MSGSADKSKANPMWGGHYDRAPSDVMEAINASISVDKRLYRQDIRGSIAHAQMLLDCSIIAKDEAAAIIEGLRVIEKEIARGEMAWNPALEDIHMHIEARLKEHIGLVAGKLHTARSRNDQIATDLRLFLRDACDMLSREIREFQQACIMQAKEHIHTIMPGFTHLQTAQPVTFAHHMMAYVEMLQRDKTRMQDARSRLNESPLGSAALAGTSFPIDRQATAIALGFDRPAKNSLDAVGSRDAALECLSAIAICATHLSRLAEELVVWTSALVKFASLPQDYTSGSSIMPQKRNPDAAELVRAKTGRINGNLLQLLTVLKGTPLAYNKDLQEDKEPVFDSVDALSLCLRAMTGMISGLIVHQDAMLAAASGGFSTATDLADWLVRELGMPFRDAHHVTGRIVVLAETKGCMLWEVPLGEMQAIEPRITEALFDVLTVERSVASRTSEGGTAPETVKQAIAAAEQTYDL